MSLVRNIVRGIGVLAICVSFFSHTTASAEQGMYYKTKKINVTKYSFGNEGVGNAYLVCDYSAPALCDTGDVEMQRNYLYITRSNGGEFLALPSLSSACLVSTDGNTTLGNSSASYGKAYELATKSSPGTAFFEELICAKFDNAIFRQKYKETTSVSNWKTFSNSQYSIIKDPYS